eukprot:gene4657-5532_t
MTHAMAPRSRLKPRAEAAPMTSRRMVLVAAADGLQRSPAGHVPGAPGMHATLSHSPPAGSAIAAALLPASGDIEADLNYLRPTALRPYSYAFTPPPGLPWESGEYERIAMRIADARGRATHIEREGFEL